MLSGKLDLTRSVESSNDHEDVLRVYTWSGFHGETEHMHLVFRIVGVAEYEIGPRAILPERANRFNSAPRTP